jgi:hypothetical protein
MPDQVWQSSIDEFQCPMCGAIYDVAITRLAARAEYDAVCNVCQKVMNEWHGTVGRAYTLKSQSANAQPPADPISPSMAVGKVDESLIRNNYSMKPHKTMGLAEVSPKRDMATECGSQGPMSQQSTGGPGRNELHPQKLVQLVGFRDPDARKHKGDASIRAVLASAA